MRGAIVLKDIFNKKREYVTIQTSKPKNDIPEGMIVKCKECNKIAFAKELEKNNYICHYCDYHFTVPSRDRINMLLDNSNFFEYDSDLLSENPLNFVGYEDKLKKDMDLTKLNEAVITGEGTIGGYPVVIGVMDSRFRMGSMGSVVGEKITRAIENATIKKYPFILFSASGGARMQEGLLSLMQMAKTSAALGKLHEKGILYISILTNPTTGGVSASFASLGDINIAEPNALIGFAGRRIIEQTIRQNLPKDFQTSEFLLEHGQIDMIVNRKDMRKTIIKLLDIHSAGGID